MPRPPDTYTHSQFTPTDPTNLDPRSSTVACIHCNMFTVNVRSLDRKKTHLTNCEQYKAWRAAGNGQELQPPLVYKKRARSSGVSVDNYNEHTDQGAFNPAVVLTKKPDVRKAFEDYIDEDQTCPRARCLHCGYVRAANTTRQTEHLLQCPEWLASSDGQAAFANGEIGYICMPPKRAAPGGILGGNVANPHLSGARRGNNPPLRPLLSYGAAPVTPQHPIPPPGHPKPTPSLANHLLSRDPEAVKSATEQAFLSHVGCGTISANALTHWLAQDAHVSRAFVSFVGRLIGKIRLPDTAITMDNTTFRTFDLLISTLNNVRREMSFFDSTAIKWGLQIESEIPKPATKGFIDLLSSASSSSASLLEGLVLLWTTEHCYRASWHYASTFTNSNNAPSSNYSLPSYMTGTSGNINNPFGPDGSSSLSNESHINALHQALIPNWTSPAFSKFVDACRSIVDEVANAMTSGNGREEMLRCEQTFRQALWLWKGIWPEVNGMGESDELGAAARPMGHSATRQSAGRDAGPGKVQRHSTNQEPIEIHDDESGGRSVGPDGQDSDVAQTPYGGTELKAVQAAVQSG